MTVFILLSRKRFIKKIVSRLSIVLFMSLLLVAQVSCKSSKPRVATTKKEAAKRYPDRVYTASASVSSKPENRPRKAEKSRSTVEEATATAPVLRDAIETALSYEGTRYKYGGTTKSGMDCSGLIYVSFKEAGKNVPRTSGSLRDAAKSIKFNEVEKGDLLFFATGKNKTRVSHVGLVVNITPAEVSFVHASTSRGVIVSTMNEGYWLNAYLSAGRLE